MCDLHVQENDRVGMATQNKLNSEPKLSTLEPKLATPELLEVNGAFYKRIDGLANTNILPDDERKRRMREYMRVYRRAKRKSANEE